MARIPAGEGFGEVVARPQRLNEAAVPRAAFGAPQAEAATQAGGALMDAAAMQQREIDAQRREELALARQEAARAKAAADAAQRARAAMQVQTIESDLDVITDEVAEGVRTGQVPKDKAGEEFKRRTQERIKVGMESMPAEHVELAQMGVNNRVTRLSRSVTKAVTQRDQADVRSGIDSQLEYAQRMYLTDPAKADAIVATTLESLGPHSGLDPQQLGKLHQGWKEGTRLNKVNTLVQAARADNRALDAVAASLNGDEFADIDPARKTAILGQIEGFKVSNIQKAESQARAAQARQEATLKRAEAEFTAAQSLTNAGKPLSQDYIDRVSKATAGTPYAAAFQESLKAAPANTAFGVQPLAVQERLLVEARADLQKNGTNPAAEKRIGELERMYETAKREYKEDPLLAAQERGIMQLAPVDTTSVAGLVQTLGGRMEQAAIASRQTGAAVSPLVKAEAEQVAKMIDILPVDQRASAVAQLAQAVGPQHAAAMGQQLDGKNKALGIAFALAGSKTNFGRYKSELVLRGQQALKDKAVKEDNAALTGIRAQVAAELGDAVTGPARETLIEASVLTYYGKQSEGSANVKEAVSIATGGVVERGGRKVVLPDGIAAPEFDKRLRTLQPTSFAAQAPDGQVYAGGEPVPLDAFVKQLPDAALMTAGNGRYYVRAGGGFVTNKDRRPIVVEVR
jgi:hypothetical protein